MLISVEKGVVRIVGLQNLIDKWVRLRGSALSSTTVEWLCSYTSERTRIYVVWVAGSSMDTGPVPLAFLIACRCSSVR